MSTILLVDDHTLLRDGLKLLLQGAGHDVVGEAGDGHDALRQIGRHDPDIVLLDIELPLINGIDVLRQLVEQNRRTRVILLSMHQSARYLREAFNAGAWGYVLKGERGAILLEAISAVAEGRRYYSAELSDQIHGLMSTGAEVPDPLDSLTTRERQVLRLVLDGKSSLEIATLLYISVKTVETYRSRLMRRLGVGDVVELIKYMMNRGAERALAVD